MAYSEKDLDGMTAAELLEGPAGFTKITADMGAAGAVTFYQPGRASSERWEPVEGGFRCYTAPTAGFGGGRPWGRILSPVLMLMPWKVKDALELADGTKIMPPSELHPADSPGAFEWVWPEAEVRKIYRYAARDGADSKQYRKVTNPETGEETIEAA